MSAAAGIAGELPLAPTGVGPRPRPILCRGERQLARGQPLPVTRLIRTWLQRHADGVFAGGLAGEREDGVGGALQRVAVGVHAFEAVAVLGEQAERLLVGGAAL